MAHRFMSVMRSCITATSSKSLKAKGARFVEELDEVPSGAVTIFSAHGVSRKIENEAKLRSLPTIDATCPLVTKVHNQGRHYVAQGRILVFIGHAGHPEVEGTLGQIDGEVHLVENEEDVDKLPIATDAPIAYVTQTTLSVDDTRGVIGALHRRFNDVAGPDIRDICYATRIARRPCANCPALPMSSSWSARATAPTRIGCAKLLRRQGCRATSSPTAAKSKPEWVRDAGVVGITAGASAPEVLVEDVIRTLMRIAPSELSVLDGPKENVSFRLPVELVPRVG